MKPTLIIADDLATTRAELRRMLEEDFTIVAETADGLETVQACRSHAPELLVIDIAMPRMSGIEAILQIMELREPRPAIVVVSGIREDAIVMQALEAGACDYLVKPVDGDALRQALLGFVKRAA